MLYTVYLGSCIGNVNLNINVLLIIDNITKSNSIKCDESV